MRKSIVTVLEPSDPVYDLTTVAAVNSALGITGNTADDALMAERITTVSRVIADLCHRTFALLTVQENFHIHWGEPVHTLPLRQYPVTELISVFQDGNELSDSQLYELDSDSGLLWLYYGRWCGKIVVQYSGGYDLPSAAPPLLAQACIETLRAQNFAIKRGNPNVRSVTHGDTSVTYAFDTVATSASTSILPANATAMIELYRAQFV